MDIRPAALLKTATVTHGPIRIDLIAGSVEVHGECVELQPKQFHMLAYLVRSAGRAVPSSELWANVFRAQGSLEGSHVRRQIMELRKRLGAAGTLIVTTRSGYVLQD